MPLPALLANPLFQQAALSGLGFLGSKLIGGPEAPDLVSPALSQFRDQQRRLSREMAANRDRLAGVAAAAGLSSSAQVGAMADLFAGNADAMASLGAQAAQAVADARNREAMIEAGIDAQTKGNQQRGLAGMLGNVGLALAMKQAGDPTGAIAANAAGDAAQASTVAQAARTGFGVTPPLGSAYSPLAAGLDPRALDPQFFASLRTLRLF